VKNSNFTLKVPTGNILICFFRFPEYNKQAVCIMIRSADALNSTTIRSRINPAGSAPKPSAAQSGTRLSAPAPGRPGIERALGDALSIAQMSQNIIQRAMTISLQLKSIAASAIASGRVNAPDLAQALSEMRSALGRYGEELTGPAQLSTGTSAKIPNMPDISSEMKSLREISDDFRKGAYDRVTAIDVVIRGLGDKLPAFKTAGDAITALMRESSPAGTYEKPVYPRELVSQIKEHLAANPAKALLAQGNINYTAADRLMA
jgi:hypothetical protein